MKVFLCEKPGQGKDIAKVLGVLSGGTDGYFQKGDTAVTWGFGHLIVLSAPDSYSEELKQYSNINPLPVLPEKWQLEVPKDKQKQVNVIKKLLVKADEVVIATDADREGEVIARQLLDFLGYRGKLSRLWIQSLDQASIKKALAKILPGQAKESLYRAGLARSHADWLVGMNFSRICTAAFGVGYGKEGLLSVGRVQTPTLALVVKRDAIIDGFKPYPYYGLKVDFQTAFEDERQNGYFTTTWQIPDNLKNKDGLCTDLVYVQRLLKRLKSDDIPPATIVSATTERKKQAALLPFSLSELQKVASNRFGISIAEVLKVAQTLYEKYKITSYPRTACRYLPLSQKQEVPVVLAAIGKLNPDLLPLIKKADPNRDAKVWNDNEVNKESHHAIIPTMTDNADLSALSKLERDIYDMIVMRYLGQFYPDHEYDSTVIVVSCANEIFHATGRINRIAGWKELFTDDDEENPESENSALPPLQETDTVVPYDCELISKKTTPPPRFTEASLGDEMKTLRSLRDVLENDKKLKTIAKDTKGLGTEATRADVIKRLLEIGYIEKKGRRLFSTEKGKLLIRSIPQMISDPVTTLKWELSLSMIEAGHVTYDQFMLAQQKFVTQVVESLKPVAQNRPKEAYQPNSSSQKKTGASKKTEPSKKMAKVGDVCPQCGQGNLLLKEFKNDPQKKYLGCNLWKFDKSGCNFFQWVNND